MKNLITIIVRDISVVQKTNSFNMTTFKSENQFVLGIYIIFPSNFESAQHDLESLMQISFRAESRKKRFTQLILQNEIFNSNNSD